MKESKTHITLRNRISLTCRKKRMSEFEDFYFNSLFSKNALNRKINILDLGGTLSYWQSMHFRFFNSANFTLLNLNKIDVPDTYENVFSVTGDATDLNEYADKQFDLVFSNSVIEHVGGEILRYKNIWLSRCKEREYITICRPQTSGFSWSRILCYRFFNCFH